MIKSPHIYLTDELKFRPIIAGPSNETHRLSNLNALSTPLTKHKTCFIRDSTDFLNQLPNTVPINSFLVSFDIENLYSNITHELGMDAIEYWS